MTLAPDNEDQKLSEVYVQRNEAVVALAAMALRAGFNAGRGVDESKVEGWDHVVYVDLPDGKQVSWHMSPSCIRLLDILPVYPGKWDGKFTGREMGWSQSIPYHPGLGAAGDTRESALRREHRRDAAERTLSEKGYTHQGGIYWKPPVGITGLLGKSQEELALREELAKYKAGYGDLSDQLRDAKRDLDHHRSNEVKSTSAIGTLNLMGFEWVGGDYWRVKEYRQDAAGKLRAELSDDELRYLAKKAAVDCPVRNSYMPQSMDSPWDSHEWVLDAMRLAMTKVPGRTLDDKPLCAAPALAPAPESDTTLNAMRITRAKELIDFAVLGLERGCSKADAYAAMLAGIRDTLERTEF